MRAMPVRVVADGVVTRSVRDTAAFLPGGREGLPRPQPRPPSATSPGPAARVAGSLSSPTASGSPPTPRSPTLTRQTAELLESLGHHVEWIDQPVPESFRDDFLLYWGLLASTIVATGRVEHGRSWGQEQARRSHSGSRPALPTPPPARAGAIRRLRRSADLMADLMTRYDVVLTPTLARETPEVGWLDPMQDYDG